MKKSSKALTDEFSQTDLFCKISNICAIVEEVSNEKQLMENSLSLILELFNATRGSIFIAEKSSDNLVLKSAVGMNCEEKDIIVKRMGEGVVGKVAKFKKPIYVSNIEDDERFHNTTTKNRYKTPSFICAPLLIKDILIGVINITDKESGSRFTEKDMQLLDFLASQIALNHRRMHLLKKIKSAIEETEHLKDELGKSNQETNNLKKQIFIQEKLATIGKLAGGIAHEFNNPLDGVMRYTNLCLDHIKDNEVIRGYLLEIKHGLDRMANIVKNLLACSRNQIPSGSKIDFESTLQRVTANLQAEISQKNIAVTKHIQKELPLILDLGLEIVLKNIIHNAIDALSDNGKITIVATASNDFINIAISDTGTGLLCQDPNKIFEPFFTTKDIDKGCGLGLTIVGEIIKNYSGKINVESGNDKGTTFCIKIPIDR